MVSNMLLDPKMKVLIVDDVLSARLVLKSRLAELGLKNIIEAEDGQDAYEKLQANKDVGLIISDWHMPVLDGEGLLNKVYESETFREIPFVMATSLGEVEDKVRATLSGVWGYIVKPITTVELRSELEDIFREIKEGAPA